MNRNFINISFAMMVLLGLSACGGSGSESSGSSTATSDVSIRFSDAPIGELSEVVITVDKLVFNREGEDIVVDRFTSVDLDIEDADTFQIDLLQVQGRDNLLVLDSVTLPVGDYQNLRIVVLDEDTDLTYVVEKDDIERKQLKVPSNELKLGSFTVSNESTQTFVVEFALNQAMTYNPKNGNGGKDRYILKPRGIRVVKLADASDIEGTVDLANIHLRAPCDTKEDQTIGNVVYLYEGHGLDSTLLGDLFVREGGSAEFQEFDGNVPANIIQPVASATVDTEEVYGKYLFSYLQPGNYTLAISCVAQNDDPVIYNGSAIPAPAAQIIELELGSETSLECNFPDEEQCTVIN